MTTKVGSPLLFPFYFNTTAQKSRTSHSRLLTTHRSHSLLSANCIPGTYIIKRTLAAQSFTRLHYCTKTQHTPTPTTTRTTIVTSLSRLAGSARVNEYNNNYLYYTHQAQHSFKTTMAAADDNIVTLIQEVASQFQRSGTDLQNIQKTTHDMREAENHRNEMMHDARTLLQSKELAFNCLLSWTRFIPLVALRHLT